MLRGLSCVVVLMMAACASGTAQVDGAGGGEAPLTGASSSSGMGGMAASSTSSVGEGGMGAMGGMGMGGEEPMGGMMGTGGMMPMCDLYTPDNTCPTATDIGPVSGDDGGTVTAMGAGATWVKVQIQETNGSIFEEDLSYTVSLVSPAAVDYDFFVYQGPQDGPVDCNATPVQGNFTSPFTEAHSDNWDDDQGIGGEDDDVWLAIEIVPVSGDDCDAEWQLTVQGGT